MLAPDRLTVRRPVDQPIDDESPILLRAIANEVAEASDAGRSVYESRDDEIATLKLMRRICDLCGHPEGDVTSLKGSVDREVKA